MFFKTDSFYSNLKYLVAILAKEFRMFWDKAHLTIIKSDIAKAGLHTSHVAGNIALEYFNFCL
jgi:hypothetical protein